MLPNEAARVGARSWFAIVAYEVRPFPAPYAAADWPVCAAGLMTIR